MNIGGAQRRLLCSEGKFNIEFACPSYIYTAGSALQRCNNANRVACNRGHPTSDHN